MLRTVQNEVLLASGAYTKLLARKDACTYLLKLGVGWAIGMGSCVVLLALEGAKMMMERKEQPGVPVVKGAKQA